MSSTFLAHAFSSFMFGNSPCMVCGESKALTELLGVQACGHVLCRTCSEARPLLELEEYTSGYRGFLEKTACTHCKRVLCGPRDSRAIPDRGVFFKFLENRLSKGASVSQLEFLRTTQEEFQGQQTAYKENPEDYMRAVKLFIAELPSWTSLA